MRKIFGFTGLPNLRANYNVAPTNAVPFVRLQGGQREIAMARWGLIPSWAKEIRSKPLINARAETIDEKPAFRSSFKRRRCLIPADGFYEWKTSKRGTKQPYYIHRPDNLPFGMAGIWDHWIATDGSEVDSLAIITTAANEYISKLHTRMPVVIGENDFSFWLDTNVNDWAEIKELLRPAKDDFFEAYPVSTDVSRIGTEGPHLIQPIGPVLGEDVEPDISEDEPPAQQLKLL